MAMDPQTRALLRGLHIQFVAVQTQIAAIDHALREALADAEGERAPEKPAKPNADSHAVPPKVAVTSEELRSLLGKPTLQETRGNVFMRPPQAVEVPDTDLQKPTASGTPTGVSAVHVPS